ncbi:MAG: N-acetylmuramoyl-L-alanine amidase [Verrucomicrobiota bacterium]|nr:MAG: N-acetylmuramoyl-L-alanine amidase [Verrucomicrobiota bacterium]
MKLPFVNFFGVFLLVLLLGGVACTYQVVKVVKPMIAPKEVVWKVGGIDYISATQLTKRLGAKVAASKGQAKSVTVTKGGATVQMTAEKDHLTYQSTHIFLQYPLKYQGSEVLVSEDDVQNVLTPLLAPSLIPKKIAIPQTIVIDPGHGGKDPGATNNRLQLQEKNLVLAIALQLKTELIRRQYIVKMTREKDEFKELEDRPRVTGDVFISLHLNSSGTPNQSLGTEVHVLTRNQGSPGNTFNRWNTILGYLVVSRLVGVAQFRNRGLKMSNLAVLRNSTSPAILIELGFINHDIEAKKLADQAFQKKLVGGIANALDELKKVVIGCR